MKILKINYKINDTEYSAEIECFKGTLAELLDILGKTDKFIEAVAHDIKLTSLVYLDEEEIFDFIERDK